MMAGMETMTQHPHQCKFGGADCSGCLLVGSVQRALKGCNCGCELSLSPGSCAAHLACLTGTLSLGLDPTVRPLGVSVA